MTAAIFGLVGVAIGGLITGASSYLMARRAERQEVRTAKMLVGDEIHMVWVDLKLLAASGRVPDRLPDEPTSGILRTREWEEHKAALTRSGGLSDRDWSSLSMFAHTVETSRLRVVALPAGAALTEEVVAQYRQMEATAAELYTDLTGLSPSE